MEVIYHNNAKYKLISKVNKFNKKTNNHKNKIMQVKCLIFLKIKKTFFQSNRDQK